MSIKHTPTSVVNKPKTAEELTAENAQLKRDNENLSAQVTDLQLALCDVYELIETAAAGGV